MRLLIGAGKLKREVLDANFSHQNILDESGTYPIISTEAAFDKLKNGEGFIASYSGNNTNIKIKNVYLALFYEGKLQKYLTLKKENSPKQRREARSWCSTCLAKVTLSLRKNLLSFTTATG